MIGAPLPLTHAALKAKQRARRASLPEALDLRLHRALSWLERAEAELDDPDARFLFLWIGFNAAYAEERDFADQAEREAFRAHLARIVALDRRGRIEDVLWNRFAGEVRAILRTPQVFRPFWNHVNGIPGHEEWETAFELSTRWLERAMSERDTAKILELLFARLHTLRDQILHGGTAWSEGRSRGRVRDGATVLGTLLPLVLDIAMDWPDGDWGRPPFPALDDG